MYIFLLVLFIYILCCESPKMWFLLILKRFCKKIQHHHYVIYLHFPPEMSWVTSPQNDCKYKNCYVWDPCCFGILAEAPKLLRKGVKYLCILKRDIRSSRQYLLRGNPRHSLLTLIPKLFIYGNCRQRLTMESLRGQVSSGELAKVQNVTLTWVRRWQFSPRSSRSF